MARSANRRRTSGWTWRELAGQPLHAAAVDLRGPRQAGDKRRRLNEIGVGRLGDQGIKNLAEQLDPARLHADKGVQAIGDVASAVGLADIARCGASPGSGR